MNERIRELEKQASDYYWTLDDDVRTADAFTHKFAELIVKECINGIANDTANYEGVGMMSYYQGVQDAVKSIRKHFGVEE
jgi:hypothetical protein